MIAKTSSSGDAGKAVFGTLLLHHWDDSPAACEAAHGVCGKYDSKNRAFKLRQES